jgi:hypothetical protein
MRRRSFFWRLPVLAIAGLLAQGCATHFDPVAVPAYARPIKAHVSSATVSTNTETPAADHLVENSQVFLGSKEGLSNGWLMLGPIGAMVGISAARSANSAQIGDGSETLSVKFDPSVKEAIQAQSRDQSFVLAADERSANVLMLPSARLVGDGAGQAASEYRLTVRFVDPAKQQTIATKDYYLTEARTLALNGPGSWAADGAANLKQDATPAFGRLVQWSLLEIGTPGQAGGSAQDARKVVVRIPNAPKDIDAVVRGELGDYLAVSYLFNGKVLERAVFLVPKRFTQ